MEGEGSIRTTERGLVFQHILFWPQPQLYLYIFLLSAVLIGGDGQGGGKETPTPLILFFREKPIFLFFWFLPPVPFEPKFTKKESLKAIFPDMYICFD